jgi:hypothetical protein
MSLLPRIPLPVRRGQGCEPGKHVWVGGEGWSFPDDSERCACGAFTFREELDRVQQQPPAPAHDVRLEHKL